MDRPRAGRGGRTGDVPRARTVDGERRVELILGTVDVGPGGAVDDDLRARGGDGRRHRGRVRDVELGPGEGDRVMPGRLRRRQDVQTEHPASAGDQDPHSASSVDGRSPRR